jgi:hypothetical protein
MVITIHIMLSGSGVPSLTTSPSLPSFSYLTVGSCIASAAEPKETESKIGREREDGKEDSQEESVIG